MKKTHQAMASVESSGNSDVDFVRLMIPHHQAAIDMAKTRLMFGPCAFRKTRAAGGLEN
jgi:uncharacterized protein (DUF305 family)